MLDGSGEPSSSMEAINKTTSLTSSSIVEEALNSKASVQEDAQQPQGTEMRLSAETDESPDRLGPKRSQAREITKEQEQDILLAQSEVKERTLDDCRCTGEDRLWTQERKRKREEEGEEGEGETEVADAVDNGNSCTVDLGLTLNEKDVLSETQQQQQKQEEEEEEDPKEILRAPPSHPLSGALPEPSRLDVFGIVGVSSWEEEQVEMKKEEELLQVERLQAEQEEEEEEENDDDDDDIAGMDYTDMTVFI